jgi:putative transposase
MRICGAVGIHYRRRGGCTRRGDGESSDDLVNRAFDPEAPDRLWCMDITEHPTGEGKVYCAVVLDAYSRRVVGWSIADHLRAELVADAVQVAIWRRRPEPGRTIAHSDHGAQYTSWLFGSRLRHAGLLGSMGSIGDCFDNSVAEAFFSSLQRELLDQHDWATRDNLARHLRLDRDLVQPPPTPQLLRRPQSHRLRDHRRCVNPTTNPSVRTGNSNWLVFWSYSNHHRDHVNCSC